MALRHQSEVVPLGEESERLLDTIDHLDRLRQDTLAEGHHRTQVILGDLALSQVLVAEAQVAAESSRAVAMCSEVRPFDLVEDGPRLFSGQRRMGQEIEEIFDGSLEVDVVLPEGVVGIKDEMLAFVSRPVHHVAFPGTTLRLQVMPLCAGRATSTRVPCPTRLVRAIVPLCASTIARQIASPNPVPPLARARPGSTR